MAYSKASGVLATFMLAGILAQHSCFAQPTFGGELEHYAGLGLATGDPYALRTRLRIRARYDLNQAMAYGSFRFTHAVSDPQEGGRPNVAGVRLLESFVDMYFDHLDVRIGHQLVVWGQMDGTFVTDVVSPLDLSEFLAQDFVDIRLAVPALKATYYAGNWSVTGLLIVAPMESPLPSEDSPWFSLPDEFERIDVRLGDDNLPKIGLDKTEPGLKLTFSGTSTTADMIYFYGRTRIPAFRKSLIVTEGNDLRVTVFPEYTRRHVAGFRVASTAIRPIVLETELAYESVIKVDGRLADVAPEPGETESGAESLVRVGHIVGGLSLAKKYGQTFVKLQGLGSILTRYSDDTARDRFQNALTILIQSSWKSEIYLARLFAFYYPGGDYWLNPVFQYNAARGLNIFVGAHVFGGEPDVGALATAAFGLFDDDDFAYVRLTLSF